MLCPGSRLRIGTRMLGGLAVVEAESEIGTESVAPGTQTLALAVDQRIQWVEEQRPHPGQCSGPASLSCKVLEDRDEKALGLARAGAACDEHGSGRVIQQEPPGLQLVSKGLAGAGKCVLLGLLAARLVHRYDEFLAKQPFAHEPLQVDLSFCPAERRLKYWICQQRTRLSRVSCIQALQVFAQRSGAKSQA